MRGSLVHDALYQLLRLEKIGQKWRKQADIELRDICIKDGMKKFRADYVYAGVRHGGRSAASPKNKKKDYIRSTWVI